MALLHFVSSLFHSKTEHVAAFEQPVHRDFVGAYKADYSPLAEDEIAHEDDACAELFKRSKPVSR
jgi:hypothetical protein